MTRATPQTIGAFLEKKAKRKQTVFYSDLAAHFELPPMDGAWSAHPLCGIFDILDQGDASAKRPFRTTVVVKREDHVPGNGFFESLANYKNIRASNDQRKLEVFASELKAVFAYPWK